MDVETSAQIYNEYADTVFRIAYLYMKNRPESEDIVQDTFVQLLKKQPVFTAPEKVQAWLIVTASNLCKSRLRRLCRRDEPLDIHENLAAPEQPVDNGVIRAVTELPDRYKTTVYLHYYMGYTSVEIARILGRKPETVRTWLARARKELKRKLGGEHNV